MIVPTPETIADLLNTTAQLEVPRYQREYKWTTAEATEFIDDLDGYVDAEDGRLFLGTIIFDMADEKKKNKIRVVDGQQRITTILLLLIACRSVAKRINAEKMAFEIQKKITFTDQATGESNGCRLISSESIRDVIEVISKDDWNEEFPIKLNGRQVKRQVNRIKPVYDHFIEKLNKFDQAKLASFLRALYGSYVVRINIDDVTEAFSIFERTNARGLDLEASDLLKNYLFSEGVAKIDERWARIIENSDGSALRMIKYYYVSKCGYITMSNLYRKIKMLGKEIGAETLSAELEEFSLYYSVIKSSNANELGEYLVDIGCECIGKYQDRLDRVYHSIDGLRLFKISQVYPLIYSAIRSFLRTGENQSKILIKLFESLEKYHFINNAICDRIGNEVEKLYAGYCTKYADGDFDTTTSSLLGELKEKLASRNEFLTRFSDLSYSTDNIGLISYVFDRINNYGLVTRVPIYTDQKLLRKNHSIEHFFPQTPLEGVPFLQADSVHNIGNLLAISFKANSKLGNLSTADKLKKLTNELAGDVQNLQHVQAFINKYGACVQDWNEQVIAQRAQDLGQEAYDKVWEL